MNDLPPIIIIKNHKNFTSYYPTIPGLTDTMQHNTQFNLQAKATFKTSYKITQIKVDIEADKLRRLCTTHSERWLLALNPLEQELKHFKKGDRLDHH